MSQGNDKKVLALAHQLGEHISSNPRNFEEAWTVAGQLNSLLKGDEVIPLPASKIDEIRNLVQGYYRQNRQLNEVRNNMFGIGKKLMDL